MPVRNVGKWVCLAFIACTGSAAVAACGGSGNSSVFVDGGNGADSSSSSGGGGDATTRGDGPTLVTGDGGDGSANCTAKTCAQLGFNCGQALQCNNTVVTDCNPGDAANQGCPADQVCVDNVCGTGTPVEGGLGGDGNPNCTPKTCAQQGYDCGYAVDGCGNVINCNPGDGSTGCIAPEFCGGGGYDVCGTGTDGGTTCTGTTCAKLGYNCGAADDGCGNVLQCGTCTAPQYCGGGGYDLCGPTNLAVCDGGAASTSLAGFVYDPANHLPVYNALVYAPVGAVQPPDTGVSASTCGCVAPPAYASTFTGIDGSFTLTGVPTGAAVPIVVQLGKWQRAFTQDVAACTANTVVNGANGAHLTLPSTSAQGNIPRFAIDTGGVDAMECVLLKMGIAQSEFADPNLNAGGVPQATQRIHMYQGQIVAGGAVMDAATPPEKDLTESLTTLESYDVTLFPCQGNAGTYDKANGYPNTLANLITYTGIGGRSFMTHYHYDMLDGNGSFSGTAKWAPNTNAWGDYYGDPKYNANIQQGAFTTGVELAAWLHQPVVYGGTAGVIPVGVIREDFTAVNAPSQLWLSTAGTKNGPPANVPIHYTFDTPFNQTPTCGRVVYSDFHVESQPTATEFTGDIFPKECPGGIAPSSMTPQEELLEFMLFDLTSCVSPPVCTPLTCAQLPPGACGPQGDGCGGVVQCPACAPPDAGTCTPETCAQQNVFCGNTGDGCGNVIQCGQCTPPQTCGGGGTAGQCGQPGGSCTPKSCAAQGIQCGLAGDGCGNILTCPNCPTGESCNTTTGQCVTGSQ
ncbi:MAG TPA: hypothetical protein VGG39_10210 [Polyangiaceae bacterium]|jgi:hypothetical protein